MKSNSSVAFLAVIILLLLTSSLLVIVLLANEDGIIVTLAQAKKKKPISSSLSHHSTTTITTPNTSTSTTLNAFQQSQQQQSQPLLPYEEKNQQGTIFNGLNNGKVVILTFGDGLESQYLYAKPILDKYGFKANFFVTCNKVGLTDSKITWQEIVQLYNEGHVIGSKTMNYGTKAMQNKDLNHLSANDLEYEVGQSKQCLLDHGINTTFFAVPKNVASNNETVINTIAKYYDFAINGHSDLMYLHSNRYSIGEYSMQHIEDDGNSYDNSQMFEKFVAVLNSQNKFNEGGMINAIPVIGYHDIIATYPDVSYTDKSSDTTLDLFEAEMKYLHDNGFRVIAFSDLGYDENSNSFHIKS
ncbi:MAG TPA: polysaccharide deacetylase family protein [Nitrososphaeraceae archaeon]